MDKTFIEIHMLQNYAPSNLNRDDTGSVKDCVFGGYPRARISSQCRKRSIRTSEIFWENIPEGKPAHRSKFLPQIIKEKIGGDLGKFWAEKISALFKEEKKSDSDDSTDEGSSSSNDPMISTSVILFFSDLEIEKLIEYMKTDDAVRFIKEEVPKTKEKKKQNAKIAKKLREIADQAGAQTVPVALFGRMTQPNMLSDVNATCQVSHAISVNQFKTDFDYFTAVDDLGDKYREDSGSAHLGETEFTSSCFYQYFAIDYDEFLKSIGTDNKALAKSAITALLKAAVLSHPTGKQNSFAAHNPAHFVGIEIKNKKIPVNLANAFVVPVKPKDDVSLNEEAAKKLAEYAVKNRKAFSLPMKDTAVFLLDGKEAKGKEFTQEPKNRFETLDDLVEWLENHLGE